MKDKLTLFDSESDILKSKKDFIGNHSWLGKANILCEALPYMKKFSGETFVIKFGGSAMGDIKNIKNFAQNVTLLKQIGINPIVVHGGGPQIGKMLKNLNINTSFVDGLRVTNSDTIDVVEMVLSGSINKNLVKEINLVGGIAVGISGKDGNLIKASKLSKIKKDPDSNIETICNLGFVGEPQSINPSILSLFEDSDVIPVIAPIGVGEEGETYNINADIVAGAIASSMHAVKLIILSDIDGVTLPDGTLISSLTIDGAKKLIKDGIVTKGMIPKIETMIQALQNNVSSAHILNGSIEHILLMEIFTEQGAGTMIF